MGNIGPDESQINEPEKMNGVLLELIDERSKGE